MEDIILICGDFNCPAVEWVIDHDNNKNYLPFNCNYTIQYMFNLMLVNGLSQINNVKNFQQKLLDLVFVTTVMLMTYRYLNQIHR